MHNNSFEMTKKAKNTSNDIVKDENYNLPAQACAGRLFSVRIELSVPVPYYASSFSVVLGHHNSDFPFIPFSNHFQECHGYQCDQGCWFLNILSAILLMNCNCNCRKIHTVHHVKAGNRQK